MLSPSAWYLSSSVRTAVVSLHHRLEGPGGVLRQGDVVRQGLARRPASVAYGGVSDDPFDLQRFVDAQADVIARVRTELAAGRKASHWMWFVFPQITGLGFSAMAQAYAIGSQAEAQAYLAHPVLGARLRELTGMVNQVQGRTAHDIFGSPDDLKFRSSMTLFDAVAPNAMFAESLDRYYGGEPDPATIELLQRPD
jgi:uncharacterized protein (DUF1810 family)